MGFIEIHQQLYIGSAPFINILIRVAYDHQILVLFRKPVHQLHLRVGAVLKLVHLDIIQPILPLLQNLRTPVKNVQHEIQKVVEIHSVDLLLFLQEFLDDLIVHGHDFGHDLTMISAAHL